MESVEINGKQFRIEHVPSRNRNAWARLRGDAIVISIPSRWPSSEKERIRDNLLKRAIKAIAKGRWIGQELKKVEFSHGQKLLIMGKELEVALIPAKRFSSRIEGGRLRITYADAHPEKHAKASRLARKRIVDTIMPQLLERVRRLNETHFQAHISKVIIRDNSSRWGSCSPDHSISLNFRLLFMPDGILDYVIVHELAHTRYKSHGKRFWALVEKAMPDHKERRSWLKQNGWDIPKSPGAQDTHVQQIFEEPY